MKLFKTFRDNKGILILVVAAVLLETVSSIQYIFTKQGIEREARKMAEIRFENANLLLEVGMSSVEVAVNNIYHFVDENLSDPKIMYDISYGVMEANPSISECGMLFRPDYYGKKESHAFHPATHRFKDNSIKVANHDTLFNNFNYYERQWYKDAMESGSSVWTDPYISRTDGDLVCTFSKPIKDSKGEFVGVIYVDMSMEWLRSIVEEGASAYPNAFSVILNKLGKPVVGTRQGQMPAAFNTLSNEMKQGAKGEQKITYNDTTSYAFYSPIGKYGWSMAIVCPKGDMFDGFYKIANLLVILMLLGLLLLGFILYRSSRNVLKLREVEGTKQRIENELTIAHGIQMGMIPKIFPPYPERDDIEIYASLTAAKEVGGDLYDFFISNEKLWFCIGDVSGKGVPASLVMAVTRSLFRTNAMHSDSPGQVMDAINGAMSEMNENNMFVTMFIGSLDLANGKLTYCNAGHNAPVIHCAGKATPLVMKPNLPIGLLSGFRYVEESTSLDAANGLFLYTDGVTEAENQHKELFGEQRMLEVLKKYSIPMDTIEKMMQAVSKHADGAEQSDDITMLSIRYRGIPTAHLSIRNDIKDLAALPEFVESLRLDMKTTNNLNLALEEAATNVVMYAYDEPGSGTVDIDAIIKDHSVRFTISDSGKPFDPTKAEQPDIDIAGEERPVGGLGIYLIRKLMDSVKYERKDGKNILVMTKKLEYNDN